MIIVKEYACTIGNLGYSRATDEEVKLWSIEYKLIEECDIHNVEQRGIDSGQDILHVLALTFEVE
jgi:hypothetical protein